ncbi:anti-sigma-D factor RsdA [Tsukamurella tyrosinosolvens]|uniref:anti-sigma-D factor RsdA n=1 Tax=Tsukamurella TaxID=2060 RepID=UPI001146557C
MHVCRSPTVSREQSLPSSAELLRTDRLLTTVALGEHPAAASDDLEARLAELLGAWRDRCA